MARYQDPVAQYLDGIGDPLVNGKLFFYKSGTNTELTTYKDDLETIENTHPVDLDAAGRIPNIFFSGSAKVILTADDLVTGEIGKQIFERDPVGGEKELGDFTLWDTTVTYDLNDIVEGSNGDFYKSLSNANQTNDPLTNADKWVLFKLIGVWNTNITYSVGDVVLSTEGNLWKSLTATSGNDPETNDGTKWIPAIDGSKVPEIKKRLSISGTVTISVGVEYLLTENATITMPDVTGFVGGERFKVVAAIAATSSTLTVDGTQSEVIAPSNGDPTDTVFNLVTVGVSFEFIFNVVTGNWEI